MRVVRHEGVKIIAVHDEVLEVYHWLAVLCGRSVLSDGSPATGQKSCHDICCGFALGTRTDNLLNPERAFQLLFSISS
jgi:hypothetical protein